MKRCSRCVLTEATPGISFDEAGVCNYCKTHKKIEYSGEEKLKAILDKHRNDDARYECICAISGGRDSAYVLLKLVRDYGMKVLALNYANPFTSPEARQNVENATRILGVDLITFESKNDVHQRVFANNFRAWCGKPSLASLPMMCAACKTFWYTILKTARQNKVKLIVGGMNRFEDTSYKKALLGVPPDEEWEKTFTKALGGIIKELARNPAFIRPSFIPTFLKAYLFGDPYALGSRYLMSDITLLDLFFYVRWDEQEVLSRLREELAWTSPPDYPSTWRFDCELAHMKDLVYMKTIGVTEKDDLYSKMVREGIITREEALKRLERENEEYKPATKKMAGIAGVDYDRLLATLDKLAADLEERKEKRAARA